jgi:hypothetical protein
MKKVILLIALIILTIIIWFFYYSTLRYRQTPQLNAPISFCEQSYLNIKEKEHDARNDGLQALFNQNVDADPENEAVGLCVVSPYGARSGDPIYTLFVLDDASHNNAVLYEKKDQEYQRHIVFKDFKVVDINKDGIMEIMYKESGWSAGGGTNSITLYSPLNKEEYTLNEEVDADHTGDTEKITKNLIFSENTVKMPGFKIELQKQLDAWVPRPFIN